MKEILIATANEHKVYEFKKMLEPLGYIVKSLKDLKEPVHIDETGTTFEENALIKAKTLFEAVHMPVMADDSGIMVDALDGAPGVYSARFLGEDTSYDIKNQYLIDAVKGKNRGAQFVCAIAYVEDETTSHVFKGIVRGEIHDKIEGEHGFGYDPVFFYPPYNTTMANVSDEMKNAVSHRGKALEKLLAYMQNRPSINLVLYQPEIPQNTGNIMRTCAATGTHLHLIEPLGFSLDIKAIRRSGMDYVFDCDYTLYPSWEAFMKANPSDHYYYLTRYGKKCPSEFDLKEDADEHHNLYFVLGKESSGIPLDILKHDTQHCMRLPMKAKARALNVSNCAAIIVYEALRQLDYPELSHVEVQKGEDWIYE